MKVGFTVNRFLWSCSLHPLPRSVNTIWPIRRILFEKSAVISNEILSIAALQLLLSILIIGNVAQNHLKKIYTKITTQDLTVAHWLGSRNRGCSSGSLRIQLALQDPFFPWMLRNSCPVDRQRKWPWKPMHLVIYFRCTGSQGGVPYEMKKQTV